MSHGQYKKAALLSYINLALTNVLGIVITPFTIKMLGDSQFGLYTLIGAFVGYLSVLDLGLNNAIIRFVAQYRAQNDRRGEENFLAVSLLIYITIGILIALIGSIFYFNIDTFFGNNLSITELKQAKIMTLILIVNLAITIPGGIFAGICSGYEEFVFPRLLTIIKYIIRIVLLVTILYLGSNAVGIVVMDTVLNLLFITITAIYVFKTLKVSIKLHEFRYVYIREIFSYSVWLFVFNLAYQLQWRIGQIILGTNSAPVVVAIYGIGVMLGIYFTSFGNIVNSLILPKAVQSIYNNLSNDELTKQMIKIGRITIIILLYVLGGFLLIGKEFLLLWVGETYLSSWIVALLIMIAYVLPIAQGYANSILDAMKLLQFKSVTYLVSCIIGAIIGWGLSFKYGSTGMIIGLFSGMFVFQIILNVYYQKIIKLNLISFFKQAVLPSLSVFLGSLVICAVLNFMIDMPANWITFTVKGLIYSSIFILITQKFYFSVEEKRIFLNFRK